MKHQWTTFFTQLLRTLPCSYIPLVMRCVKWKYNLGHHSEGAAHLWLTPKQHFKDYRFMHRGGPSASTCGRVTSWQVGMNNVTVHCTFDSWNHDCINNYVYKQLCATNYKCTLWARDGVGTIGKGKGEREGREGGERGKEGREGGKEGEGGVREGGGGREFTV